MSNQRVPFSVVDEAIHLLDTPSEPWTIQLEVRVQGRLDDDRLRRALAAALARHPMARARKIPSRRSDRRYQWEITSEPDLDPLRVVDCPDDAALATVRSEVQSVAVPLGESPPLRARLAHHPEGDVVMLALNHGAMDGFGGLRLLRSVARAYAGEPDPLPEHDPLASRDIGQALAARDARGRAQRYRALMDKLADLVAPPSRLATEGGTDRPGYDFHHRLLGTDETRSVIALEHPGTVNDVLLAALHLTIEGWNAEHGARTRRVTTLVPANLRPREWWSEVAGNFTLMARVATDRQDRVTPGAALRSVTAQTRRAKEQGTWASLIEILRRTPSLPLWAKEATSPLLWLSGNRLVDTALITNLGRLDDPPSFGPEAGPTTELWFSAPGRMPMGVTMGAVTLGGRLHLSFRYRHPLLGPAAARRFAERYVAALDLVTGSTGPSEPVRDLRRSLRSGLPPAR